MAGHQGRQPTRLVGRVDCDTVGRIISRVCADELDPDRLENLFEIGSMRSAERASTNYLTLVADHLRSQIVWGTQGNSQAAANRFFGQIGRSPRRRSRCSRSTSAPGTPTRARARAPGDHRNRPVSFRGLGQPGAGRRAPRLLDKLRGLDDPDAARRFEYARWSLLKAPDRLND